MSFTQETVDRIKRMIESLQGDGYAKEGNRDELVTVWAEATASAVQPLENVEGVLSPDTSPDVLLEVWDQRLRLPNDAARTGDERRARAVAANAVREASPERIAAVFRALGVTTAFTLLRNSELAYAAGSHEFVHRVAFEVDSTVVNDTPLCKALNEVLRRLLPVKLSLQNRFVTASSLQWETGSAGFGTAALAAATGGVTGTNLAPARKRRFGPLSAPSKADLKASLSYQFRSDVSGAGAGGFFRWCTIEIPSGGSAVVIDSSADYTDRFVMIHGGISEDDLRPKSVAASANVSLTTNGFEFVDFLWGGEGGGAFDGETFAGVGAFKVDDGELQFIPDGAAPDLYLNCLIYASGKTGSDESEYADQDDHVDVDSLADWSDFTVAMANEAFERAAFLNASGSTVHSNYPGHGAIRRVAQAVGIIPGEVTVIDSSDDWRDRLITPGAMALADNKWLGLEGGDDALSGRESSAFYSGAGATDAQALDEVTVATWAYRFGTFRMWADSTTGALKAAYIASHPIPMSLAFFLDASGPMGRYNATTLVQGASSSAGDPVLAQELNIYQDCGFFEQGHQAPPVGVTRMPKVQTLPLGPALEGNPPIAIQKEVVFRDGKTNASTFVERQKIADAARMYWFGFVGAGKTVTIDATRDWSERLAMIGAAISTSDIMPTNAPSDFSAATVTAGHTTWIPAVGEDGPILFSGSLQITTEANGVLRVKSLLASAQYLNIVVQAGPKIGYRNG